MHGTKRRDDRDGEYPISRDLYIYVKKAKTIDNEAVSSYVDLYLGDDGLSLGSEVGYVDLPEDQISRLRVFGSRWRLGAERSKNLPLKRGRTRPHF